MVKTSLAKARVVRKKPGKDVCPARSCSSPTERRTAACSSRSRPPRSRRRPGSASTRLSLGTPNGKVTLRVRRCPRTAIPVPPDPPTMSADRGGDRREVVRRPDGQERRRASTRRSARASAAPGQEPARSPRGSPRPRPALLAAALGASLFSIAVCRERRRTAPPVRRCCTSRSSSAVTSSTGWAARLGRVDDLIVRLGEDDYPPVTGLLATVAGRQVFVPAEADLDDRAGARGARGAEARPAAVRAAPARRCCCARTCSTAS